jgi:hypothetical protein
MISPVSKIQINFLINPIIEVLIINRFNEGIKYQYQVAIK